MRRALEAARVSAATSLAVIAPLAVVAGSLDGVVGVAVLAVVISGAVARASRAVTMATLLLLLTDFAFTTADDPLVRAAMGICLIGAATAYALYEVLHAAGVDPRNRAADNAAAGRQSL